SGMPATEREALGAAASVSPSKELQPHVARLINSAERIQREIYRAWHSHMLTVKEGQLHTPGLVNSHMAAILFFFFFFFFLTLKHPL
uniref:Uncharacterized protein n=1 Tax=Salarias fasciatus TaxID=181472 RepID=A0A672HTW7_SALFA